MTRGDPVGESVLLEFRDVLDEDELRRVLSAFGAGDAASLALRAVVGEDLDLGRRSHRDALLVWLRAWGCRHLRRADSGCSSAALARWWRRWSGSLPPSSISLVDLSDGDLEWIENAYGALAALVAARRASARAEVAVAFGDTAAAKALFALRPRALPPWDEPIRLAFGTTRHDGALYRRYVSGSADAVRGCAMRLGADVDALPARLGRPASTPAKLIDEYLWLRVTRAGRRPPR